MKIFFLDDNKIQGASGYWKHSYFRPYQLKPLQGGFVSILINIIENNTKYTIRFLNKQTIIKTWSF